MNKRILAGFTAIGLTIALTAGSCDASEAEQRKAAQNAAAAPAGTETLEIKNLKEKRRREESASAIRYLYVLSFGKPLGYYVTKGKISSNGSQAGPELEAIKACGGCSERVVLDSAQDDGSYGDGDPGIFFFTTDGTMVVTSLDYIQSDQPMPFNVPQLRK